MQGHPALASVSKSRADYAMNLLSLEKADVIDAAGIDSGTHEAVLTLTDALNWDDEDAHHLLLRAKLDTCLAAVSSGKILDAYPHARGRTFRIDIFFRYAPPSSVVAFPGGFKHPSPI